MNDPFDERVAAFQRIGLSEAAAKIAAVGRDGSEAETRRTLAEAARQATQLSEAVSSTAPKGTAIRNVTAAAKTALRMTDDQAQRYAVQLYEREKARHNDEHACSYLNRFALSLSEGSR